MSTSAEIEAIKAKLLPQSLLAELPGPELKGLGLLAREIADSDLFEIDDEYNVHTFHQDARVTLHVHQSVRRRVKGGNRHLACSVEFWEDDICITTVGDTPATDDCFSFVLMAKAGWPRTIVPDTLYWPMKEVLGLREKKEEERRRAEEAEFRYHRKLAYLRSREKEDWEWILSHFTTEEGRYIPDYY